MFVQPWGIRTLHSHSRSDHTVEERQGIRGTARPQSNAKARGSGCPARLSLPSFPLSPPDFPTQTAPCLAPPRSNAPRALPLMHAAAHTTLPMRQHACAGVARPLRPGHRSLHHASRHDSHHAARHTRCGCRDSRFHIASITSVRAACRPPPRCAPRATPRPPARA